MQPGQVVVLVVGQSGNRKQIVSLKVYLKSDKYPCLCIAETKYHTLPLKESFHKMNKNDLISQKFYWLFVGLGH